MTSPSSERGATVTYVRNERARRYIIRVPSADVVRCTIPRRGNLDEAVRFVQANAAWIESQRAKRRAAPPPAPREWRAGHDVIFRGEQVRIDVNADDGVIRFGDQIVPHRTAAADLRPLVERRMRMLAAAELPVRVRELAAAQGLRVHRITVRAQRSRWGSCSHAATISLNWRLIQAPPFVRDYVIVHELMHLRHMNHSDRFWDAVDRAFPDWRRAEAWLKRHSHLIR